MDDYHKDIRFWVMIAAFVAHSLSATIFTEFGFVVWTAGSILIAVQYFLSRSKYENHRT